METTIYGDEDRRDSKTKRCTLRRIVVKGKSREENMRFTLEVAKRVDIMHSYIMRRLFQRNIQTIIQKSLNGRKSKKKN